ncbi:MAG: hypothetical protein ACW97G_03795 [Candidatus Thorarchaeota archaeon]|jgi:hypothetical protein
MTKTSDRYAKWFGTRVPLVSRGGLTLFTFLAVLPFSAVIFFALGYTILGINWLIALGLFLLVGILFHFLFLLILITRYRNPSLDPALHELIGRIHQKTEIPSRVQVWVRSSEEVFIASTFNLLFDAVIISEPMVNLILKSPESGEVLLAFHLFRAPRSRWFGDFVGGVILFVILSYLSASLFMPMMYVMMQSILINPLFIIYSLGSFSSFIIGPILFIIIVKGTFWRHEPAFVGIQKIFNMHPNVAKVQVEKGITLDEDEVQSVIWGVRDWEKTKRSGRRMGLSALAAAPTWLLSYFLVLWFGFIPYSPFIILLGYLPFILAGVVALIVYLALRRWDKEAMGEVFQKTTDYDEPIWVD